MKKIFSMVLILVFIFAGIPSVYSQEECISQNKTVTVKTNPSSEAGSPQGLVDGSTKASNANMYYQWNWSPWFCIDLGGYYEISGLKWLARYETTTGELEAQIYGAISDDWSDKELIVNSQSGMTFEHTISENRPVYRYIIVERSGKGCGLGGKEFYVYGKDVSQNYTADKAQDNNSDTYWMSSKPQGYLQLDLGEERTIKGVSLSARCDKDNKDERANFEIWLSNDIEFNNYVIVPCVTTLTNSQRTRIGQEYEFKGTYKRTIDLPDKYRYLRYVKFSGIATLSEINILTGGEEEIEDTQLQSDFEVKSGFIDSVGDKTDVFVKNSYVSFAGDIKNNTNDPLIAYAVVAAYNSNNMLTAVNMEEICLKSGQSTSFDTGITSSDGKVLGYVWEKGKMKPVCKENSIPMHKELENAVYVSYKNGNDQNDGSVLSPFKTIEKAKDEINKIKGNKEAYIRIKNGEYTVGTPIELTASDSGSENAYINYEGFGTDETIISAGKRISGFTEGENGIYYKNVSDADIIKDIYVNGERRNIASSEILVACDEVYDLENQIYGPVVSKEQLPDSVEFSNGMEIYYPSVHWRSYAMKLEGIDNYNENNYILKVEPSLPVEDREKYDLLEKFDARAFYLRNSKSLLDEEGEWYFDENSKTLFYKPYTYEDMNSVEIVVSGIDTVINMNNAKYIRFDGLTIAHTGWSDAVKKGEMRWQGHSLVLPEEHRLPPSALYASYCENIDIVNCVFKNLGAVGIGFNWGIKNCNINGNVFYDIADSAMYIGNYRNIEDPQFNKGVADLAENISVRNNVITNTGTEYHTSAAVQIYSGKNIAVEHNDISHCPYSAISVGPLVWKNDLADSDKTHKAGMYGYDRICNNRIHETNKLNPDGGAIYTLAHNHGTVISGNYIKNQYMDYGAVYNDRGSACFDIYNNVMEDVKSWLYEWSKESYFINAYNNYSTTDESYGGYFCQKSSVEEVNLFLADEKPQAVKDIISNSGLEKESMLKIGKYIPSSPDKKSPVFKESKNITVTAGESIILNAEFTANASGRYRWKATGENSDKVSFKDTLHGWLNKGRQFKKIYASFEEAGEYEIICESDDERGYIYSQKMYITVKE